MIFKKPLFLLLIVVFIAIFLRVYKLGSVPPSLNWDEVSLGYNAYSILHTGKDEYGKFLPLVLQSYDDYKPALYTYLAIPTVSLLGLTEIAIRLPSVTAGIIAIILVYFLIIELLGGKKVKILDKEINSKYVGVLTALFLAISPWHIQFSRIAFESNAGLTINIAVFYLFLKGLKKPWFLPISFFVGALNIHMYQSDRVFTPLFLIALSLIFYKQLLKVKKWFIFSVFIAFLVALPFIVYTFTNSNALLRAKGVSVFSDQHLVERSSSKLLQDSETHNIVGKIFDNRRIEFGKAVVSGYISHFDLNWLFITGDIERHHAPFMGLLYLFELPFLFIGIYILVFLKFDWRYKLSFFFYFLLVPIPASITSGVPHAVRTLNFEWTFEFFIALGLITSVVFIYDQKNKIFATLIKLFIIVYCLFAIINISYYINQYFVQQNYYSSADWLYGYKQMIFYVDSQKAKYDKVIVENQVPFDQSYMFFLFYLKVDPLYYQSLGGTKTGGFKEEHKGFYNLTFRHIPDVKDTGKILIVGKPGDIPENLRNRKVFYYLNGDAAIAVAEK
jgi:4-amino-4-deoxy-L-arabinose transferase-like glycosyltransferase